MEEATTIVTTIQPFITALTGAITVSDIVLLLGAAVGAGAGLYLAQYGIRKVMNAVRKGLNGRFGV